MVGDALTELVQAWLDSFRSHNVQARLFGEHAQDWTASCRKLAHCPALAQATHTAYYEAYYGGNFPFFASLSVVLELGGLPAAIWPLYVYGPNEAGARLGSCGGEAQPPLLLDGCPPSAQKTIYQACLEAIDRLGRQIGMNSWTGVEHVFQSGCSPWHKLLLQRNSRISLKHEVYVDLSLSEPQLTQIVRRRYRSMINRGKRLWSVSLHHGQEGAEFIETIRKFHLEVAGKVTRSAETWELQARSVEAGESFCLSMRDEGGFLVGASIFAVSTFEGVYAVGVYQRALFDQPVAHLAQWEAILEMKKLGLSWYRIGERSYPITSPNLTEKEYDIAFFKEGFASHMYLKVVSETDVA